MIPLNMLHKRHWITKSSQQISINTINPIQKKKKIKKKKKLNRLGEPKTNQLLLIRPRVTVQLIVGHVLDNTKIQKHQYKKNNKKKERKRRRRRRREQNKSRPAVTLRKQGWRSGGEWLRVRVRLRVSESVREELGEVKVWNWVRLRVSESEREKFGEVCPNEMRGGWVSLRCELKSEEWGVRVYIYIYIYIGILVI